MCPASSWGWFRSSSAVVIWDTVPLKRALYTGQESQHHHQINIVQRQRKGAHRSTFNPQLIAQRSAGSANEDYYWSLQSDYTMPPPSILPCLLPHRMTNGTKRQYVKYLSTWSTTLFLWFNITHTEYFVVFQSADYMMSHLCTSLLLYPNVFAAWMHIPGACISGQFIVPMNKSINYLTILNFITITKSSLYHHSDN